MTKKIIYISGTRADYGLMRSVLENINNSTVFDSTICATGMHLMPEFGETVREIHEAGFRVIEINATYEQDDRASMAEFVGIFIRKLTKKISKINPDMILILGDRGEMLGAAIVGTYMNIPLVHIHGGDISSTVDEHVRHAITKLAHIHLAATEKSAERIKRMGENPGNVHVVGAPGLDEIINGKFLSREELARKYQLDLSVPFLMVVQHPVSTEIGAAADQISETLAALIEMSCQSLVIYPNADAGGREMIEVIRSYKNNPFIRIFPSIPHHDYLSLIRISSALVGNSSSGIIEAASLGVPVIDIGSRQQGREHAENVIHVQHNRVRIGKAVQKALYNERFLSQVKKCKNPYGDGHTADRIVKILSEVTLDTGLFQKRLEYK